MNKCNFTKAWIGKCNVETENEYCEEHSNMKCSVCGEQATHDCYETGFLVCGSPLCSNKMCEIIHYIRTHKCQPDENKLTSNELSLIKIIMKQDNEYRDLMIKYFEKQKPMKINVFDYGKAHCPICNTDVHGIGKIKHCFNCGQKLEWL